MKESEVQKRLVELTEGVYVESDVLNVVEKIRAYDSRLDVKFCDPARSTFRDAPYIVVERGADGFERVVTSVWKLDDTVLEQIYLWDAQKHDILAEIDKANAKVKKEQEAKWQDKRNADKDLVAHVFGSSKGRYSFKLDDGSRITVDDDPQRKYKKEPPK